MFYSQCLLSRDGPLGAIWVAAYFFKKLKRSQVIQIDLSSSVDKILQDEFDAATYRVLAFLLLGIVRVFSKKVEYLFEDCNKVLLKIRDFVVTNKDSTQLQTLCAPYFSITVPERFELDAFDLEILEDNIGGHVLPQEDITLKESASKGGAMLHSADEHLCEDCATCDICTAPQTLNEDVLSSHRSKFYVRRNLRNMEESMKKSQGNKSSLHESVGSYMPSMAEQHQYKQEQTWVLEALDNVLEESNMQELWGKSICGEALFDLQIFSELGTKKNNPARLPGEHQTDVEMSKASNETQLQVENHQVIEGHCDLSIPEATMDDVQDNNQIEGEHCKCSTPEASTEKLRDNVVSHDGCGDTEMFDIAEEPSGYSRPYNEDHQKSTEREKLLEIEEPTRNTILNEVKHQTEVDQRLLADMTPPGNMNYKILTPDDPLSVAVDATPKSKFPNASGVSTPELLGVPTPVSKERSRLSRKRKCLFDDMIVYPNKVVKQYIEDPTDLVCRRKKAPRTALAAWRATRLPNFSHCLLDTLIPYNSPELTSLFNQKKLKIRASLKAEELQGESAQNVESLQKLDEPKARLGETMDSEGGLNVPLVQAVETPHNVQIPQSPAARSPEQAALAPETPLPCGRSARSLASPDGHNISDLERVGFETETAVEELSLEKEQDFDLSYSNEGIDSNEGDKQEQNGLSSRTRVVIRQLNRCFLAQKKQGEEETINLMPLFERKTKKKSAILFYEILVLKSKGYVDVKQETPYEEIIVSKSSRWEQSGSG